MQLVDARADFGCIVRGNRQPTRTLGDKLIHTFEHLGSVQTANFTDHQLHASAFELLRSLRHPLGHNAHGWRFDGLQDHP